MFALNLRFFGNFFLLFGKKSSIKLWLVCMIIFIQATRDYDSQKKLEFSFCGVNLHKTQI